MSYGVNAPVGLQPYKMLTGATYNGAVNVYPIQANAGTGYATSLFMGDPVTLLADGTIGIGVAGSAIVGVFVGCQYFTNTNTWVVSPYWPESTLVNSIQGISAFVIDDPNVVFNIQSSSASNGVGVTAADLNADANFILATDSYPSGNTISGNSIASLDTSAYNGAETNNLKIIGFTPAINNPTTGNAAANKYNNTLVIINNHLYKGGTGTAGV